MSPSGWIHYCSHLVGLQRLPRQGWSRTRFFPGEADFRVPAEPQGKYGWILGVVEVRGLKESRRGVHPKGSQSTLVLIQDYLVVVIHMPQYPDLDQQL